MVMKIPQFRHVFLRKRFLFPIGGICVLLLLLGGFYYYFLRDLPSPTNLSSGSLGQSTQIFDRNGKLLYTIYGDRNQTFIPLSQIPKQMQEATIAIEDKDFYRHGAVDFRGIIRAFYASFIKHEALQGGSTLTQQLVKNSLLTQERTWQRKIKEVALSFATETLYSKDKILEMYLNQVPYGGTSYGVEAAAQTYFGKPISGLSLAQQAFLAGLPEEPSTFSPFGTHPELGKDRQEEVLQKMQEQGYISKKQLDKALKEQLTFQKIQTKINAPHFVFYVKDLLVAKYGEKMVEQGGLKVTTSLDLTLQNFAQDTVASQVAKIAAYHIGNGAALITDPATGEILAMVGSKDYFDPKFGNVNMTLAKLQPGSSIKPINYAVGLMKGYTAATPFVDEPICFPGKPEYCPQNYDGKFHGLVQMRFALGNSINIPAVEMLKTNGLDAMIATASAMGISTFTDPSEYGLSLTLGGGEVTMLDMSKAYGVFANQGYRIDLHPILKVSDNRGRVLENYTPPPSAFFGKQVLPASVTFIISHILLDNNARIMEFGPDSELKIGNQPVSVKTGTTNDFRDNWTIGYTYNPHLLVAVWVGNNDHTPMRGIVSGVTGAAPIWHIIMSYLLENKKAQFPPQPTNVVGREICSTTGQLPPSSDSPDKCPTRFEYFIKGTEGRGTTVVSQKTFIDKGTNDLAKPGQTDNVDQRDETILIDPAGNKYCLSCPHPTPTPTPGK